MALRRGTGRSRIGFPLFQGRSRAKPHAEISHELPRTLIALDAPFPSIT